MLTRWTPGLTAAKGVLVEQVSCLRRRRCGDDQVVGDWQQVAQGWHHGDALYRARRLRAARGAHVHVEGAGAGGHGRSDPAEADEAEGAAGQHSELSPPPALRRLADPGVGQPLLERQHHR